MRKLHIWKQGENLENLTIGEEVPMLDRASDGVANVLDVYYNGKEKELYEFIGYAYSQNIVDIVRFRIRGNGDLVKEYNEILYFQFCRDNENEGYERVYAPNDEDYDKLKDRILEFTA